MGHFRGISMKKNNHESGQVLILLVLALTGMFAFTALAIDGGMVYSDRRIAQNGADAASLAGAGKAAEYVRAAGLLSTSEDFDCSIFASGGETNSLQAAIDRADSNGFEIDTVISDKNGVTLDCDDGADPHVDVRVLITTQTQTSFAHLVFGGSFINTVEAVTRVRPRSVVGQGNAIVSLTDECSGTLKGTRFDGNGNTTVTGGGIFSHSCIQLNGHAGTITVTDGSVNYMSSYNNNNMTINVTPTQISEPLPIKLNPIDPPEECKNGGWQAGVISGTTAYPGAYSGIRINNNEELDLKPGLYCILNGNFVVNGGAKLSGSDVTIFLDKGNFDTAGLAEVNIDAPPVGCEAGGSHAAEGCPPSMGGMLIFAELGDVSLLGTSDSSYIGTVYAPNGLIEVGGTSSEISDIGASLIGNTVKVHGDTEINIHYRPEDMYHWPTQLDFYR
jgi:hypothetical protein